jgi:hypothetical protein
LVFEAHDYGFDYSNLSGYSSWLGQSTAVGYFVTGSNPQPLWIGEFGTCNTASTCVSNSNSSDNDTGLVFSRATSSKTASAGLTGPSTAPNPQEAPARMGPAC